MVLIALNTVGQEHIMDVQQDNEMLLDTTQKHLEKQIRDVLQNDAQYVIDWRCGACRDDGRALFTICGIKIVKSVATTRSASHGVGVRSRYTWTGGNYRDGYVQYEHENSGFITQSYSQTTFEKKSSATFFLQFYVELDERRNTNFKYCDSPANAELPYMANVRYQDFVDAEKILLEAFISSIHGKIATAQSTLRDDIRAIQTARPYVVRDRNDNPVCRFTPNCDELIADIRSCAKWLKGYIYYGNDRRKLHKKLFHEISYSDLSQKADTAITPLVADGNAAYANLTSIRKKTLEEFWKNHDAEECLATRKNFQSRIQKRLRERHSQWTHDLEIQNETIWRRMKERGDSPDVSGLMNDNLEALNRVFIHAQTFVSAFNLEENDLTLNDIVVQLKETLANEENKNGESMENSPRELDTRPYKDIAEMARNDAYRQFPKSDDELHRDDILFVQKNYPKFIFGQKITIDRQIKKQRFYFSGYLKKVGPGKVMIGNRTVTLSDLPEEIRVGFEHAKYDSFVKKMIASSPVSRQYRQKREETQQLLIEQAIVNQYKKNDKAGLIYADGLWLPPHTLIAHALKEL